MATLLKPLRYPILAILSLGLLTLAAPAFAQSVGTEIRLNAPGDSVRPLPEDSIVFASPIPTATATNDNQIALASADDDSDGESNDEPKRIDHSADSELFDVLLSQAESLSQRESSASSIKLVLLLGALSLAPAILLMTTSYIRIIVVLSLLRQAFGGQQMPPTQVITSLSLFLTLVVMMPVWNEVKTQAIDPYAQDEAIDWQEAWHRGIEPVKRFMATQIEAAGNTQSIAVFYQHSQSETVQLPSSIEDVPINILLPAFIVSELKVAFLLGFQIFLPFLILDFVVSTVTISMGMMMLPPTMVSFPLKLILFVMVDGWSMVVGMLLQSFSPFV